MRGARPFGCACLPHTRGGVSSSGDTICTGGWSSPHAWGCFRRARVACLVIMVFPTRVGVFPPGRWTARKYRGLPHTRGGVSCGARTVRVVDESSPHAWGCFLLTLADHWAAEVFPTRVGVFLEPADRAPGYVRLPHTRGGVSGRVSSE